MPAQTRLAEALAVPEARVAEEETVTSAVAPVGVGGAPMMGGAPTGRGGNAGGGKSHNAAAFLHTADQGDEIIGDLGGVAPAVIGARQTIPSPDIDLKI